MTLTGKLAIFHFPCDKILIVTVVLVVEFLSRVVITYISVSQTREQVLSFLDLVQVSVIFSKDDFIFVGTENFFLTT